MSEFNKNKELLTEGKASHADIEDSKESGMLVELVNRMKKLSKLEGAGDNIKIVQKSLLKYYDSEAMFVAKATQALVDESGKPKPMYIKMKARYPGKKLWELVEILAETYREVLEEDIAKDELKKTMFGTVAAYDTDKAKYYTEA